jgi:peptidyl-prolyl cis-trans isomerase B (cyclophilin B)
MARTRAPHSATAQFFINTVNNPRLDFRKKSRSGWGYCVFGRVVEGIEVVTAIENAPTTKKMGHRDVPVDPIIIKHAAAVEPPPASDKPSQ